MGGVRFVALGNTQSSDGLKVIDLGAGHSSGSETLCGRVITALKSGALLNESVGAGYIDRHWPPVFKDTGAWPLTSLRQSFRQPQPLVNPDPRTGPIPPGTALAAPGSRRGRLWSFCCG